jgi:DNA-binding HxlR family transcriptional regulator
MIERCPLNAFHQAVGGKYKMRIVWELIEGPKRFGELSRSAIVTAMGKPVTARVMSRELKELEQRGIIRRKQYPVVPPKVEYSLTEFGRGVVPVIRKIVSWGLANREQVAHPRLPAKESKSALRASSR